MLARPFSTGPFSTGPFSTGPFSTGLGAPHFVSVFAWFSWRLSALSLVTALVVSVSGCSEFPAAKGHPAGQGERVGQLNQGATAPPHGGIPQKAGQALSESLGAQERATTSPGAAAGTLAPEKKQPFSIDALYQVKNIADPQWSPDGRQLLFVVTSHDLPQGKSNSDIYLVQRDGNGLRRMTRHEGSDSHPRWSPDGRSFLFVSSRSKTSQVWRMPIDGGEPEQLTDISTGVSQPSWTPDGKKIAFVSSIYPEHGADDAANKAAAEAREKSPFKAYLADELLFRHWSFYKEGQRDHILLLDLKSKETVDLTPGDFDSPAFSLGGTGFALSPDGQELCFVSNREPGSAQAWTTNKDLWVVPLSGSEPRNITPQNPAFDGDPAYSPDGQYLAFLRQKTPGYESDRLELALFERRSGKLIILTSGLDSWVLDLRWAADSRSLVIKTADKGRFPLLRVAVPSGTITRLPQDHVREFALATDGQLAFSASRVGAPQEIFWASTDGKTVKQLTTFNQEVTQTYDVRPVEELWLPGADGKKVHTFIVKPHGFQPNKRYPLIINVHGGPQYQWADTFRGDWQVYPAAGYVVAFFNPHGSIGYGQKYTAAISKDWGGKVFQDVMRVTDALTQLPYVDASRLGAMGWSYGGYMMNWLLGHTDRFKAIVSMMGIFDLVSFYGATEELWFPEWDIGKSFWKNPEAYRKWSPSTYAHRFSTPTLVISGEKDFRVPYTQSLQLFTALRRQGVPARLLLFPNDGHWPSWVKSMPLYYAAHLEWFQKYLGGGGSPYAVEDLIKGTAFQKDAP